MSKLCVFRGWSAILNIHERTLAVEAETAGRLLDSLSSRDDLLWPRETWPPMVLDRGLTPGSRGGHSVIRYSVGEFVPGRRVEFEFQAMPALPGFRGRHYFEVMPRRGRVLLRHTIDVETGFRTWLYWKVFIERLHDALIEDAFDKAERNAGVDRPHLSRWPLSVRLLRRLRARKAAGA
jgi:hypothetical protein